jgi:hypothetical protein
MDQTKGKDPLRCRKNPPGKDSDKGGWTEFGRTLPRSRRMGKPG